LSQAAVFFVAPCLHHHPEILQSCESCPNQRGGKMKLEVAGVAVPVLTGLTGSQDSQNFLRRDLCACIIILKFWNPVNPVQISVEER
jgi:hypothetical protein